MSNLFVIIWMIFFHIVDDYYLQGWLASAKQKTYWEQNASVPMYKYDYIWALIMHSCSWAFMIMFPIAYIQQFSIGVPFITLYIFNAIVHAIIDNVKANIKAINLWEDQIIHMLQIFGTYFALLYI